MRTGFVWRWRALSLPVATLEMARIIFSVGGRGRSETSVRPKSCTRCPTARTSTPPAGPATLSMRTSPRPKRQIQKMEDGLRTTTADDSTTADDGPRQTADDDDDELTTDGPTTDGPSTDGPTTDGSTTD